MTQLPRWALPSVVITGAIIGFFAFRQQERQIGALQYAVRDDVMVAQVAKQRGDSIEKAFRIDTVKVFRRITKVDSVFSEIVRSDTLRMTDTVKVTVEVIREAQETLLACRATVLTCGQLNEQRAKQIDALEAENRKIKQMMPSKVGTLLRTAGWVAVGYGLGRIPK